MNKYKTVLDFLKIQEHMVISTVDKNNKPESALVGFGQDEDLILMFGTYTTTRKYKNILNNNNVAVVFSDNDGITVQYEGKASVLIEPDLSKYKELYFTKNPSGRNYENYPHQIYIKISPVWIRYTDIHKDPEEVFEIQI